MIGQKRRQPFVERRIHQTVDAAFADPAQRRQRDREIVERQSQVLSVEVAPREDLLAKHQRIVRR